MWRGNNSGRYADGRFYVLFICADKRFIIVAFVLINSLYTVSQKTWCRVIAITSSTVNRFKNSFTVGNNNELSTK